MRRKRLIRVADGIQEDIVRQIGKNSRDVLQDMEQLKYEMVQAESIFNNTIDEERYIQNRDLLDKAQTALFDVALGLENPNLLPAVYDESQLNVSEQGNEDYNLQEEIPLDDDIEEENEDTEKSSDENAESESDTDLGEDVSGDEDNLGLSDEDIGGMDFNF